MLKNKIALLLIGSLLGSVITYKCKDTYKNHYVSEFNNKPHVQETVSFNDKASLLSVLYQQHAAEYTALCFQAYNSAYSVLNEKLKTQKEIHNPAIITDLDETAIDNSDFYGWAYKNNTTYSPAKWTEWCKHEKADSIAGSVTFFNYANSKHVDIYYISNRDTSLVNATMNNMRKLGFPQVTKDHFLFKSKESSKDSRRKQVAANHNVLILLGDNLNDFDSVYEKADIKSRKSSANMAREIWGTKYIVLPNATYGDWENAFYSYNPSLSLTKKDSLRIVHLRSY